MPSISHQFLDWSDRVDVPEAKGRKRVYLELYRRWMRETNPLYCIFDRHERTKDREASYIRLQVKRKSLGVLIQEQFAYGWARDKITAIEMARAQRDKLPTELIMTSASGVPEIPGLKFRPSGSVDACVIIKGTKESKSFSVKKYPNAYHHAVKWVFDRRGVRYPKGLFDLYTR